MLTYNGAIRCFVDDHRIRINMKMNRYIKTSILVTIATILLSSALVEAKSVFTDDKRLQNLKRRSKRVFSSTNRNLRDWKADWWDAAEDFEISAEEPIISEESLPMVTISSNSPVARAEMNSNLGPGKVGTPSNIAQKGESFDVYELTLYFTFFGIDEVPLSSEIIWEIVTTEHLADHIGNICDYAYKNMNIRVTMTDQITNGTVLEIAQKVMSNATSNDSTEGSKDPILIMKTSIYVVMTDGVDINRTSTELILESFNSDEKTSIYFKSLKKTADVAFTNLTNVSILRHLPTAILMDEPEDETPTFEPVDSINSPDTDSSGGSAFVGLLLGFSVCTLFFVGVFRGPLKHYVYHKRSSLIGASFSILDQKGQDNFDVEIIKDSDVSTLGSRTSPYSADFHVNPEIPSVSQRFKERFSKLSSSHPVRKIKISSPPSEVFTKLKAGEYSESFDDEDSFFELIAPPGMLGIIVESPDQSGPKVHGIKVTSPFYGQVSMGDKLIAVDGEDTTNMSAIRASKLISYKSSQKVRRLLFKKRDQSSVY